MLDPDLMAFVRGALPPPPARVLEVGAGNGEMAEVLAQDGYEVTAIDPASQAPNVRAVALHELEGAPGGFDAALAVVSLHHVEPLAQSCRRLGELVRSGGTLVVDEFDVERFDERAARWWLAQRRSAGEDPASAGRQLHPGGAEPGTALSDPAGVVAERREHLHWLCHLSEALEEWFRLSEPVRGPYLYRWDLAPGSRTVEEQLICTGGLPATGARLVGTRR